MVAKVSTTINYFVVDIVHLKSIFSHFVFSHYNLTYALSLPVEQRSQTTCHHPAQSYAVTFIFLQLYSKLALPIFSRSLLCVFFGRTLPLLTLRYSLQRLFRNAVIIYVAAKATYIRLLHGKIGILDGFFGPSSVHRGRTHIVLGRNM